MIRAVGRRAGVWWLTARKAPTRERAAGVLGGRPRPRVNGAGDARRCCCLTDVPALGPAAVGVGSALIGIGAGSGGGAARGI